MRITALTIENFKIIGDPVRIEFKPITLLFGINSAGKSTIVQALHYVQEILERANVDADCIVGADESFNLGGFKKFVHNHDLEKKIKIKVELDISDQFLPRYMTTPGWGGPLKDRDNDLEFGGMSLDQAIYADLTDVCECNSCWVELTIQWSHFLNRPVLVKYSTGINGEEIAEIRCERDGSKPHISMINFEHATLRVEKEGEEHEQQMANLIKIKDHIPEDKYNGIEKLIQDYTNKSVFQSLKYIVKDAFLSSEQNSCRIFIENSRMAIPVWGEAVSITQDCYEDYSADLYSCESLRGYLSQVVVGPGELLLKLLKKARYIGPIRKVPTRRFESVRSEDLSRWSNGLAAWDSLYHSDQAFVSLVDKWLSSRNLLDSGYRLKLYRYKALDVESPLYLSLANASFMDEEDDRIGELVSLPEQRDLVLVDEKKGLTVSLQDVGVGISQLLPVVVGALSEEIGLLMVEQPELHIHPGLQCRLGDLFIHAAIKSGKQFLIETHSEHLLLRLLRRIREQAEGELPPGIDGLSPEQLSVNYVDWTPDEGMQVSQLAVSPEGDSAGEWPKGFFEERAGELF